MSDVFYTLCAVMKEIGGLFGFFIYVLGIAVFACMMVRVVEVTWESGLRKTVRRWMRRNKRLSAWARGDKQ